MGKGIFIIGTDTDVGKTFVNGGITYKLKESGHSVISYKPVQSGGTIPGDCKYVKEVCDLENSYEEMNSYCLKEEVSPHLAARMENTTINKEKIINHYKELIDKYEYVIVEGAGGVVVPLIENKYFVYDLIKDLGMDVVIVARAGVGTINHTVLTNEFLKQKNIKAKGIIINQYNEKFYEDDNIESIENLTKLQVVGKLSKINDFTKENIVEEYKKLDLEKLKKLFD